VDAYIKRFKSGILESTESAIFADPTLSGRLTIAEEGSLSVSYAPFDHIERSARIIILGITPGKQQAANALVELRRQLLMGNSHEEALMSAKTFASFWGPMRANLIALLDYVGVADLVGCSSSSTFWAAGGAAHFTSALRYPVFVAGKNYAGNPSLSRTPFLLRFVKEYLAEESAALPDALWVPLGPAASEGVKYLIELGLVDAGRVLLGLPHPSGANGERIAYFLKKKAREALSPKTNAAALDTARAEIASKIERLRRSS
jgi:hypothetical protein